MRRGEVAFHPAANAARREVQQIAEHMLEHYYQGCPRASQARAWPQLGKSLADLFEHLFSSFAPLAWRHLRRVAIWRTFLGHSSRTTRPALGTHFVGVCCVCEFQRSDTEQSWAAACIHKPWGRVWSVAAHVGPILTNCDRSRLRLVQHLQLRGANSAAGGQIWSGIGRTQTDFDQA